MSKEIKKLVRDAREEYELCLQAEPELTFEDCEHHHDYMLTKWFTNLSAQIEREARIDELNKILTKMPETRNVYVRVNANGVGTLSEISDYLENRIKELE